MESFGTFPKRYKKIKKSVERFMKCGVFNLNYSRAMLAEKRSVTKESETIKFDLS